MKVLNFGSLNYDHVYSVPHIVAPGETVGSNRVEVFYGGKGLNQSVALARAGTRVFHAGFVGPDGDELIQVCRDNGIDPRYILSVFERTGSAIIQVEESGENAILLFPGANHSNTREYVDSVLKEFSAGDAVLIQNEINHVDYIIQQAAARKMRICLNPSPFGENILEWQLDKVETFLINRVEGQQLTGEAEADGILEEMKKRFPNARTVLTLGEEGVICQEGDQRHTHGVYDVPVVDTTGAGDTFTGHFLSALLRNSNVAGALRLASVASALSVSKMGAIRSIPTLEEVLGANLQEKK